MAESSGKDQSEDGTQTLLKVSARDTEVSSPRITAGQVISPPALGALRFSVTARQRKRGLVCTESWGLASGR